MTLLKIILRIRYRYLSSFMSFLSKMILFSYVMKYFIRLNLCPYVLQICMLSTIGDVKKL